MNILALDCATKTGWAVLIDGHIETGVQDFSKRRGESNGMMFLRFTGWLNQSPAKFDVIVYEQAHHRGGPPTEICVNLTGRAQEYAAKIGAECMSIHTATLKKAITGKGRASKEDMMEYFAEKRHVNAQDDNEADAFALLMYAMRDLGINA